MKPWEKYGSGPWAKYGQPKREFRPEDNPTEYDPASPEFQAKYGPIGTGVENFDAGVGQVMTNLARGAGQYLGLVSRDDVAESRNLDAPLNATTGGKIGRLTGAVATALPVAAIPGVNTIAGATTAGAVMGALQPSESTQETLTNIGVGGAAGAAGQVIGQKVGNYASQKLAQRAAQKAANVTRDATVAASREAGYVIPPSTVKPTVTNRVLESLSGKAATQQAAAVKNQQVTNAIIRKEFGFADDVPLTPETMAGVRDKAGQVYEAVKSIGTIRADNKYLNQLTLLSKEADKITKSFPKADIAGASQIRQLQDELLEGQFDAGAAVEFIKALRKQASDNLGFSVSDPAKKALGLAQKKAAGILEGLIERNLDASGNQALMQSFKEARTAIAKSYTVERAMNEGTGNVVATKLAAALKKDRAMSGGIKTVAKFGQAFPKAAAEQTTSPGVSAVDALVGGVGSMTVNPSLAMLPVGRMVARGTVLSAPYQNTLTAPGGSRLLNTLRAGSKFAPAAGISVPTYVSE